jgi:hypothetical protein
MLIVQHNFPPPCINVEIKCLEPLSPRFDRGFHNIEQLTIGCNNFEHSLWRQKKINTPLRVRFNTSLKVSALF